MNWQRLTFIFQSILMMLLLGVVYTWSVLGVEVELVFQVNATLSGLPYMVSLVSYAFAMLIAGKWMFRARSFIVGLGVTLFLSGWFLSSLVSNIWLLTLTYGLLLGLGVGLLYGVPIYIVQRTFTSRVGLFSGLILMGFGLSSTVMTPIISWLLTQQTLQETFFVIGLISAITLALTVWSLVRPLDQTRNLGQSTEHYDLKAFRLVYVLFMLSLISGLMMIGLTYRIGVISYQYDPLFVTIAMSTFALINGITRPFFGWLVDRFGFYQIASVALVLLLISGLISLLNGGSQPILYAISFGAFWFGLGNWMALMPLAIKRIFPPSLFSALYGKLFTAYGVAAIIGTLFSGVILDLTQTTWPLYALIVLANLVNIIVLNRLKKRHQQDLV